MQFEGRSVFILPLKIVDHLDCFDHFWSKINLIYDHPDLWALLIKDQHDHRTPWFTINLIVEHPSRSDQYLMFNPVNPVNPSLSFNPSTPSISSLPGQESQLFSKRKEETKNEETFHPFVSSSSNSLPNGHYHTNLHHYPSNDFTQFFLINQNFFSSKLYIFWGYTFLLHTAKRCDSDLTHRRWKENDQEIYKESSKKNSRATVPSHMLGPRSPLTTWANLPFDI